MDNKVILIYDGNCPLCRGARNWVVERVENASITTVACQSAAEQCSMDKTLAEKCQRAMCLLLPDGSMHSGVDALPHLLVRMRGWKWAGRLLTLPGFHWIAKVLYFCISRNRYLLSRVLGLPYGEACCGNSRDKTP